jgi:hypothetical protein
MNRFRLVVAAGVATSAVLVGGAAALVHADTDPASGKQVLDAMCIEDKGAPVFTPYAIGRCQAAHIPGGAPIEQLVCERLLGGTFVSSPTVDRPSRTNWACIPGASGV